MISKHQAAAALRRWWAVRRPLALIAVVAVLSFAAAVWLAYEFWRLLFQDAPWGAIDLRHRHRAVQDWIAGRPVYTSPSVLDPPATHVLLWPLLGWTGFTAARWIWAVTSVLAVVYTASLMKRHSGAESPQERSVAALLPFSIYATGATIGNGQLAVHLLPLLVAACSCLCGPHRTWRRDTLAAALFVGALVKPNLSAPFFWIVLFVPGSIRPAALVCAGYTALTVAAAMFQEADLVTLFRDQLARASAMSVRPVPGNVANLHVWLGVLGFERLILPVTAGVIAVLGLWVYRYRRADPWLLLGATAYVSLFASYHRWYDEVLMLLPMVALFRVAKLHPDEATAQASGVLLALTVMSMLAPGGLFLFPRPLSLVYVAMQIAVWIVGLAFLMRRAMSLDATGTHGETACPRRPDLSC